MDFISLLLDIRSDRRPTAKLALDHEFLKKTTSEIKAEGWTLMLFVVISYHTGFKGKFQLRWGS
jgi:hypothetical protein